jgi:hypothetical protein
MKHTDFQTVAANCAGLFGVPRIENSDELHDTIHDASVMTSRPGLSDCRGV